VILGPNDDAATATGPLDTYGVLYDSIVIDSIVNLTATTVNATGYPLYNFIITTSGIGKLEFLA
jgi:hypothetical protein